MTYFKERDIVVVTFQTSWGDGRAVCQIGRVLWACESEGTVEVFFYPKSAGMFPARMVRHATQAERDGNKLSWNVTSSTPPQ